ncbi:MAG: nucleotidyltransferase domain-containing protein [Desulfomonile tiedjei]|nr:nucleotidyltransferase domain-containing protein [Desulfomonile tiedjei]
MNDEIYIFGSAVRGEVSPTSDVDVLVIATQGARAEYPASWSVYSPEIIESYFREGRLFAWHLHLEAQRIFPLEGASYLERLGAPASYTSAQSDISDLEFMLAESLMEIRSETNSLIYELGIVYTAIRDIAMAASWIILEKPSFSRYTPYILPTACPLPIDAYRGAMLARHQATRGTVYPFDPGVVASQVLASPVLEWANNLRRAICPIPS